MKLSRFHASNYLIWALLGLAMIVLAQNLLDLEGLRNPALALIFVLLAGTVVDMVLARRRSGLIVKRIVPETIPIYTPTTVTLELSHSFRRAVPIELIDHLPEGMDCRATPLRGQLLPGKTTTLKYSFEPLARGAFNFGTMQVRMPGPLRLVSCTYLVEQPQSIRVYPDFSAIAAYTIMAADNHISQLGIRKRNQRGGGSEFHQLRQYRIGDVMRQINWKATSKWQKLISQDYQVERDQQIMVMVDNGRRMRSKDDVLSHFDHSLNALLLVCYIALKQGDSVGVMSFGSSDRWIPMNKGAGHISTILNGLFDLDVGNSSSDYVEAAERLITKQKKRSLVIMLTNTRDEDMEDLVDAGKLLTRRHIFLVANIREKFFDTYKQNPVKDLDTALQYCGIRDYLHQRHETGNFLRRNGIHCLDCSAAGLAASVANSYLEIKSAGLL